MTINIMQMKEGEKMVRKLDQSISYALLKTDLIYL